MTAINSFLVILLLAINQNMKFCNSSNISITGSIKDCLGIEADDHIIIFTIDNQTGSVFYICTSSLFFCLELIDFNGEKVMPFSRGETPYNPEFFLVKKGKSEYTITFEFFKNYPLISDQKYNLNLSYYNSIDEIDNKELLVGKYDIGDIPFNTCKK